MNSLKLKNKSKIKNRDWYDSNLDKEENRFVENLHPEAWKKTFIIWEKIRKYGIW